MATLSALSVFTKPAAAKERRLTTERRVGIYAGAFDPIHSGHLSFALQAVKVAKLDSVVFLPERRPRSKPEVEHFGHRTAMIARAIKPYDKLALLELPDVFFDITRTLPKLEKEFIGCQLVMLMGGEVACSLPDWPDADKLLKTSELVVGLRDGQGKNMILSKLKSANTGTLRLTFIKSSDPKISSSKIRNNIKAGRRSRGLLSSVSSYASENWLYTTLPRE